MQVGLKTRIGLYSESEKRLRLGHAEVVHRLFASGLVSMSVRQAI
jgi:hypothetical protein